MVHRRCTTRASGCSQRWACSTACAAAVQLLLCGAAAAFTAAAYVQQVSPLFVASHKHRLLPVQEWLQSELQSCCIHTNCHIAAVPSHHACKGSLADQQPGALLVLADLLQGTRARPVPVLLCTWQCATQQKQQTAACSSRCETVSCCVCWVVCRAWLPRKLCML